MFLRRIATATVLLFAALFCHPQQAKADWTGCGTNYGADYYDAAVAQFHCDYSTWTQWWPAGFWGGHDQFFQVCGPWVAGTQVCSNGQNNCPSGELTVISGCASTVNYAGCNCPTGGGVGDPINVTSGNVFESETDFTTVGQDRLAVKRFYNSYLLLAEDPNSSFNPQYTFMFSRF